VGQGQPVREGTHAVAPRRPDRARPRRAGRA
jgi:hypothetical protein